MTRAATMYGQSCRVVGRREVGPLQFGGASLCWGRSVTLQSHRSVGISQVCWVYLARQYIVLLRPWLPLRMESSASRTCVPTCPRCGGPQAQPPCCKCRGPRCAGGGGGVVGGEKEVGAVYRRVAGWCVVVGG